MFNRLFNMHLINLALTVWNYSWYINQNLETYYYLSTLCGLTSKYKNIFWTKANLPRNTIAKYLKILTQKENHLPRSVTKITYLHLLDLNIGHILYYIEVGDHFDQGSICSRRIHWRMRGKRLYVTEHQLPKNHFHRADYCTVCLDLNDAYSYI